MKITIGGDQKISEFYIQTFSLLFFPEDNSFGKNGDGENHIKIYADKNNNFVDISLEIWYNNKIGSGSAKTTSEKPDDILLCVGRLFYEVASGLTGIYPPWGIHTGIRPAKTAGEILGGANDDEALAKKILCRDYLMSESKAELAIKTHKNGRAAAQGISKNDFSLYVSVPFCPSRCKYCSFVSFPTPRLSKLIPQYIKKLTEEIGLLGKLSRKMRLRAIYFGGGTPSVLECGLLETIFVSICDNFDFSNLLEFTVECGRADTITKEKLMLLKNFGVDRISVNPQSLNDEILQKIGRKHTAEDFFRAFETARASGIKNINTDCIIGLADEAGTSVINTAKTLSGLKPENITLHALCIKRSSELKIEGTYSQANPDLNETLDEIYKILNSAGYIPYYMYRQKYAAGNLENTGFCQLGRECLYNIYMMDEHMTIFGVGAGAMTKIVRDGRIERIANYKYPYEYIERDFQISGEKNKNKLRLLEDL
ncbi:MAG: coproporphyrinogen dehydrogenase HemZ [Oscillospiraceae bacterium]|nr:coproporphyrinogen dehydrogenase HemZ [Oscillospiraceae bacterium]